MLYQNISPWTCDPWYSLLFVLHCFRKNWADQGRGRIAFIKSKPKLNVENKKKIVLKQLTHLRALPQQKYRYGFDNTQPTYSESILNSFDLKIRQQFAFALWTGSRFHCKELYVYKLNQRPSYPALKTQPRTLRNIQKRIKRCCKKLAWNVHATQIVSKGIVHNKHIKLWPV